MRIMRFIFVESVKGASRRAGDTTDGCPFTGAAASARNRASRRTYRCADSGAKCCIFEDFLRFAVYLLIRVSVACLHH